MTDTTQAPEAQAAPADYCNNCFFFKSNSTTNTDKGLCRLLPPVWRSTGPGDIETKQPTVTGMDWCGYHKRTQTG